MKKIKYFSIYVFMALVMLCCSEETHTPITPDDGRAPGVLTDVSLTPLNGGFDITYTLPNDSDLLYVKAFYTNSQGEESSVVSSVYNKSLQVLGYGNTDEKTISLQTIDRSGNTSDMVVVKGVPLEAVVDKVAKKVSMIPGWGGATFDIINEAEDDLIIDLFGNEVIIDEETGNRSYGDFEVRETLYTNSDTIISALRGYDPVPTPFAVVVRDPYGNKSDTIYPNTPDKKIIPWEELLLDKSIISEAPQPGDDQWDSFGTNFLNTLDGVVGSEASTVAHTPNPVNAPYKLTIDMGADVILSRFTIWKNDYGLNLGQAYGHNNPKTMDVYGASVIPNTDGSLDGWTYIGRYEAIKPSGDGPFTTQDEQHVLEGDEFDFEDAPQLRYFRIFFRDNWGGSSNLSFSEISFWGRYE